MAVPPVIPGAYVLTCSSSVYGALGDHSVVVGPIGFAGTEAAPTQLGWNSPSPNVASSTSPSEPYWSGGKLLAVVKSGQWASVSVPLWERPYVSLLFDPSSWNQTDWYRVRDGQAAVTFVGCAPNGPFGTGTQFAGGLIVAGNRCVVLSIQWEPNQAGTMRFGWGAACP